MNGYSQLSDVYELKLTKECPGSGEEFGGTPFAYVGLKVLNYDPQLGLPPKPHHTVKPTLYADINGEVTLTLSCSSSAYAIYYYISGEWRDYFTILETDCTDPTGTYIKGVKLPGNFNIREWVSCDYGSNGTRYIAAGPFGRSVDCDQMNIHIPNQFFTGAYGTQENEFILKVNRVNRLTGQVSHLTSFSFTAENNSMGKLNAANLNSELNIETCASGTSNLYIDFNQVVSNALSGSSSTIGCGDIIYFDVSLGVKCLSPDYLPIWHLGWIDYTYNYLDSEFPLNLKTTADVDAQNGSPYQNIDPYDGILLNVATDPNGSLVGPLLGNGTGAFDIEVNSDLIGCIESVKAFLYKYETCSAPFDPSGGLVQPVGDGANPYDLTNQFSPTNTTATVVFSAGLAGQPLDVNSCYYIEIEVENSCGEIFTSGGRFRTGSCTYCRTVKDKLSSIQVFPTQLDRGSIINIKFDTATLSRGYIRITDIRGMLQSEHDIPSESKTHQINALNLTPGMYLVDIAVDGLHEIKQIVVQ